MAAWGALKLNRQPSKGPTKITLLSLNANRKKSGNKLLKDNNETLAQSLQNQMNSNPYEFNQSTINIDIPKQVFQIDHVRKIIEDTVGEQMAKSIENRRFNNIKSLKLCQELAIDIRNKVKEFEYANYRYLVFLSIIEKNHQSLCYRMKHFFDIRMDNFTKYHYENSNIFIVAVVFLIHKK